MSKKEEKIREEVANFLFENKVEGYNPSASLKEMLKLKEEFEEGVVSKDESAKQDEVEKQAQKTILAQLVEDVKALQEAMDQNGGKTPEEAEREKKILESFPRDILDLSNRIKALEEKMKMIEKGAK
jgi:hypothetical protein